MVGPQSGRGCGGHIQGWTNYPFRGALIRAVVVILGSGLFSGCQEFLQPLSVQLIKHPTKTWGRKSSPARVEFEKPTAAADNDVTRGMLGYTAYFTPPRTNDHHTVIGNEVSHAAEIIGL